MTENVTEKANRAEMEILQNQKGEENQVGRKLRENKRSVMKSLRLKSSAVLFVRQIQFSNREEEV